ncbi:hypothetical protein AAG906_023293 [Vitis piasezkii]
MGSCVSVHRNPHSAMKLKVSFGSKDHPSIAEPPIGGLSHKAQWSPSQPITPFRDFGSKEEIFFDSQPWLESDSDDFHSVNGDFTPSRGNTPVHPNVSIGTPHANKAPFENRVPASIPTPSPTGRKKKLAELFEESIRNDMDGNDENILGKQNMSNGKMEVKRTILDFPPESANGTPLASGPNSVCSGGRTPNGDFKSEKEKPLRSTQCCLPSLRSNRSFNERKKKMSPAVAVNDKP